MEFFGGLLVLFGAIVFPLILIIGLVKPSLIKKPDKTPANRKQIAAFSIIASLLCLGIGGAMLPAVDDELTATAVKANKTPTPTKSSPQPALAGAKAPQEAQQKPATANAEKTLPDFSITSDEFVKNYNAIVVKADKNLIIDSVEDGQSVSYAPMPSNATMSGVVTDDGKLRGVILAVGDGGTRADNLKVIAMSLAAANAVQGSVAKEEISQAVLDMLPAAIDNKGKSQKRVIGNASYAANFSESLGGLFFTIDAV